MTWKDKYSNRQRKRVLRLFVIQGIHRYARKTLANPEEHQPFI